LSWRWASGSAMLATDRLSAEALPHGRLHAP
jgi:hypothetical protein